MDESYNGPEKRRYRRIKKQLVIKIKLHVDNSIETISGYDMVLIEDIDAGGTLINYDKQLELNTLLDLSIKFGSVPYPINCIGKVVRIEPPVQLKGPRQLPIYHIAVSFIDIKEEDRKTIDSVIQRYYSQSKVDKKNPFGHKET